MAVEQHGNAVDLDQLRKAFSTLPIAEILGIKLVEMSAGHSRVALRTRLEFLNTDRILHGGIVLLLADHACGIAVRSLGPYVSANLSLDFIAAVDGEVDLLAEAAVVHAGRKAAFVDFTVKEESGRMVARGKALAIRRHQ